MRTFLKVTILIVVLALLALFSYDFYMRNSGLSNRVDYEIQKREFRNNDYVPETETYQERREERIDEREQRREERRERRRRFFNGE